MTEMLAAIHACPSDPVAWCALRDEYLDLGLPYRHPTMTVNGIEFSLIPGSALIAPFYLGIYPVTQAQWQAVMGDNPSQFEGKDRPVENVSWDHCQAFCAKAGFRLPTEVEWEYACRAGTTTEFWWGDEPDHTRMNYHESKIGATTTPVGSYPANPWGLYDVHGNVWEWTSTADGSSRMIRGGSWSSLHWNCRSAYHFRYTTRYRYNDVGFRVALDVGHQKSPGKSDPVY